MLRADRRTAQAVNQSTARFRLEAETRGQQRSYQVAPDIPTASDIAHDADPNSKPQCDSGRSTGSAPLSGAAHRAQSSSARHRRRAVPGCPAQWKPRPSRHADLGLLDRKVAPELGQRVAERREPIAVLLRRARARGAASSDVRAPRGRARAPCRSMLTQSRSAAPPWSRRTQTRTPPV